ncbi:hypothetical protein D3C73_1595250 [compost metagenome]
MVDGNDITQTARNIFLQAEGSIEIATAGGASIKLNANGTMDFKATRFNFDN